MNNYICEYTYNPEHKIIKYLGPPLYLRKRSLLSIIIGCIQNSNAAAIVETEKPYKDYPVVYTLVNGEKVFIDYKITKDVITIL